MKTKITPTHIQKLNETTLSVVWSDQIESEYNVVDLRKACVCARCVDEMTREQILKPEDVSDTVRPIKVKSLGLYALSISWTDGHSASIYSWESLRTLADEPL